MHGAKLVSFCLKLGFVADPALNGSSHLIIGDNVYLFGGQCEKDLPNKGIFKINRNNPQKLEKVADMAVARVDPKVMQVGTQVLIIGGSDSPRMEVFDSATWKPVTGLEAKSASFFTQLSCYTSDLKLENCSQA
jgi:hypothetical protein